jgi:hypothetical protein
MLTFEALTFTYFIEPNVWKDQAGSMTSGVVRTWQLTAACLLSTCLCVSVRFPRKLQV